MFSDPLKNLRAFGLKEDDIVADLGAGTGFYSISAGHIVLRGKVYAVELEKDFLETIKNKVKEEGLSNVEILYGNVEESGGTKIASGIADAAIVSNILFQVDDKENFIAEIKRILRDKGRVLLVDWLESSILNHKRVVPRAKAREMFEKHGFILQREIDAGAHHYGMILIKN